MLIAKCVDDGFQVLIPEESGRHWIASFGDVDVEATFLDEGTGARFWFHRQKQDIFSFSAKDLVSDSLWIAVDESRTHIAFTYGEGESIGRFHVRVFSLDGDHVRDDSKSIEAAVADFKKRHYCKPRGNNVTALKWIRDTLLLLTEVYPTGDCGTDMGHLEGYVITVPEGQILEHLTLAQLRSYPTVCLQNDEN